MSRRQVSEINAGSMADIAFLLLIFFLVTTTLEVDSGIARKIPPKQNKPTEIVIRDKNILEIDINKNNELFVEGNVISLSELKQIAIDFIDNGGGLDVHNQPCDWCNGFKIPVSSDHPSKAFISIKTDRQTTYETYIAVLDNINSSYALLRNRLSEKMYHKSYTVLVKEYKNSKNKDEALRKKITTIRDKYPVLVSDLERD